MTGRHRLSLSALRPPAAPPAPVIPGSVERWGIRRPDPGPQPAGPVAAGRTSPAELGDQPDPDELLSQLPRWGWTMVAYGERHTPDVLVAHYRMDEGTPGAYVDVFVLRGPDLCGGYRARIWPNQDPVDVYGVTWSVIGDVSTVLAALLNLRPVEPGWPDYDMPPALRSLLPNPTQRRRTIRPPQ
ncbi:MAG TPA: hypothetical protein VFW65_29255 [Pseudonocardiaceae bacterium]|nr:hypothetical protein [Pseudonocardiaceae bacterium]